MIRLASVIDSFEADLLNHYRDRLLPSHLQALNAMKHCRTDHSTRMLAQCPDCNTQRFVPHSCGHRNCPHCQHHESQQWLERQLQRQVPAEYFLITFTLPAELRPLAWSHQRTLYGQMIRCSWETVQTFARNDKQLQGAAGAITVLHTHSRRLDYHPHVHLVMPAAALDLRRRLWRTKRSRRTANGGYLFNHKALAKVFRAKLLEAISEAGLTPPACPPRHWMVDCKHVGRGEKAILYLGRYLYRGVIQEKDILTCRDGQVSFRYRNAKTGKAQLRTLPGSKFLWLLLQHVLPKRFRRARNFGFLHPNSKRALALLQHLLRFTPKRASAWIRPRPALPCPCCGAPMKIVKTRLPSRLSRPLPIPIHAEEATVM